MQDQIKKCAAIIEEESPKGGAIIIKWPCRKTETPPG